MTTKIAFVNFGPETIEVNKPGQVIVRVRPQEIFTGYIWQGSDFTITEKLPEVSD